MHENIITMGKQNISVNIFVFNVKKLIFKCLDKIIKIRWFLLYFFIAINNILLFFFIDKTIFNLILILFK